MDQKNNAIDKTKKPYYGWVIVAVSALVLFFSGPGQTYSISIFIDYYVENFGWGRTQVSSYYSMATLVAGFALPMIGRAIDKRGQRKMVVLIAFALGMAALWMSFVRTPLMLIVGFFFMRLLGQGSMSLLSNTLVPAWFLKNRGKALSLMALGGVIGSAVVPPFNNFLLQNIGAPGTWRAWTALLLLVMIPAGWIFVRNRPEDLGLLPDGPNADRPDKKKFRLAARVHASSYPWDLNDAIRTRSFWLLLFCMIIPSMINTGIIFHIVSIMGEKGLSPAFAASILSIMALSQFPMTFVAGFVVDNVKVHYVKGANYLLYFVVVGAVLMGNTKAALVLYAVLHGVFMAFDSVSTGVIWPNYYGSANLGSIRSVTMTAMVVGSALGPLPFGIAFDVFGGYREILMIMMAFPVLGALASFASPAPDEPFETMEGEI
ncbi:MAG: MFS transporter [Bacillota bacterium]